MEEGDKSGKGVARPQMATPGGAEYSVQVSCLIPATRINELINTHPVRLSNMVLVFLGCVFASVLVTA